MTSRLALESWQLFFPALGIGIFAAIFCGAVYRVCRMKPPSVGHLEQLPLQDEAPRAARADGPSQVSTKR